MFLGRKNQYCEIDYTSNPTYRFNVILVKLPMAFVTELEQKVSQFRWKHKRPQIPKAVLRKKSGAGGINLPDFRLYTKLQSSRQYDTGTERVIQTNETRYKAQK